LPSIKTFSGYDVGYGPPTKMGIFRFFLIELARLCVDLANAFVADIPINSGLNIFILSIISLFVKDSADASIT